MGLGNLNPGGSCGCEPPFLPTTDCQLAGVFWNPISVTISTPVYGGLPLHECGQTHWPVCGKLAPNPARVTTNFKSVTDPQFECYAVANSFANYGTNTDQINCYGLWKIYDGSPSAFLINSLGWNVISPPYVARAEGAIGRTFFGFPYRYYFSMGVACSARLLLNNFASEELGAWVTNQTQGVNWYRSSNIISGVRRESIYRSTDGLSTFGLSYVVAFPGTAGNMPPWCGGRQWWSVTLSSYTQFIAYEDDPPNIRGTREINVWEPDPPLDLLGLTTGATASISLATQ